MMHARVFQFISALDTLLSRGLVMCACGLWLQMPVSALPATRTTVIDPLIAERVPGDKFRYDSSAQLLARLAFIPVLSVL